MPANSRWDLIRRLRVKWHNAMTLPTQNIHRDVFWTTHNLTLSTMTLHTVILNHKQPDTLHHDTAHSHSQPQTTLHSRPWHCTQPFSTTNNLTLSTMTLYTVILNHKQPDTLHHDTVHSHSQPKTTWHSPPRQCTQSFSTTNNLTLSTMTLHTAIHTPASHSLTAPMNLLCHA